MISALKTVLMGALLTTSVGVAPASADNGNIGRVILGVAGIAALATLLDQQKPKAQVQARSKVVPAKPKKHRHVQQRVDYQQCLRQRWTQSGWQSYVSNRCVNRLNRQFGQASRGYNQFNKPYGQRLSRR